MMNLQYSINGTDLSTLGVTILSIEGLIDLPKAKAPLTNDVAGMNGTMIENSRPLYEVRKIKLECLITATDASDYTAIYTKYIAFLNLFNKTLNRFKIVRISNDSGSGVEPSPAKPLVYEVALLDTVKPKMPYMRGKIANHFTITLTEMQPLKQVWQVVLTGSGSVSFDISVVSKFFGVINIYWGDGTETLDITANGTCSHSYLPAGTYEIIISGNTDLANITTTSNATQIWKAL